MEVDPALNGDRADGALIASLTHRHRNQIQTMQSLVGLFARDLPEGRCRDAFTDLRARFEAVSQTSDVILPDDEAVETDFGAFAERIVNLLDPDRLHRISIDASPLSALARRAETMRNLLTEMTIGLFRQGLPATAAGAGDITVATDVDGAVVMRVSAREALSESPPAGSRDLGWTIANSLAGHLGAKLVRASTQPLVIEARIPATGDGR